MKMDFIIKEKFLIIYSTMIKMLFIKMEKVSNTLEVLKMVNFMVMEKRHGLMGRNTRVISKMDRKMGKGFIFLISINFIDMKEIIKMEENME